MKTTNLDTSKRLKELGYAGESEYVWVVPEMGDAHVMVNNLGTHEAYSEERVFPAYTFEELWQRMPDRIIIDTFAYQLHVSKLMGGHARAFYQSMGHQVEDWTYEIDESPTEALSLLLIWCIENEHVAVGGKG